MKTLLASLGLYLGAVIWFTWPLAANLTTHLPATGFTWKFDGLYGVWQLAWQSHALATDPWRFAEPNIYHPTPHALFYGPTALAALPFFAPPFLATGNAVLAMNLTFLLAIALTAWTLHLVVQRWTRTHLAGVVAASTWLVTSYVLWAWLPIVPYQAVLLDAEEEDIEEPADGTPAARPIGAAIVERDVVYATRGERRLALDIYRPRAAPPRPVILYIHGGGWGSGSKNAAEVEGAVDPSTGQPLASMRPFLRRGLAVVSVEYRLSDEARAPAALDDCREALRWVQAHGAAHGLDVSRIVPIGPSAGGLLALMLTLGDGARAAGVVGGVDLYGIADVAPLLEGPTVREWAQAWIPDGPDRRERARAVSPLHHVRRDVPPILIVHGDRDPVVPYRQALALRAALAAAGAWVELVTVPGGAHGRFALREQKRIEQRFDAFLAHVGMVGR